MQQRVIAVVVAAGGGSRAGGDVPKQYRPVAGRPMLAHAVAAFARHPAIDAVILVVPPGDEARAAALAGPVDRTIAGGATRRESSAAGVAAAEALGATAVLIHDAARPFPPADVIAAVVAALAHAEGAMPALAVADTLARGRDEMLGDVTPRDGLFRVQTPQGFRLAAIRDAHARWNPAEEATDDAQMVRRLGGRVALVQGSAMLDKVTYPQDFAAAEARVQYEYRTATGFDVHRLEPGEELWLGGVRIDHSHGLSGHSDADVGLHALTDALLGTVAAGDIGQHFPPSDPQWRGAESGQFLRHALSLVRAAGGEVTFADLTLICEAPKIGPHRDAIRERVAELLDLPPTRVSLKATTTERLGFTGRGEGIAAQAAATVRLPLRIDA